MLEIQRLRTEKDAVLQGLQKRNIDATETVDAILAKDTEWRAKKNRIRNYFCGIKSYCKTSR